MTGGMSIVPPSSKKAPDSDGFDFFQDGLWFSAPDPEKLVAKVADYRNANGIPLGNLTQEVLDFNASKTSKVISPQFAPTFREHVIKWLELHLRVKSRFVDNDEANRRASICAKCPKNVLKWQAGESCNQCVENANRATAIILSGRMQHKPIGACEILQQSNTVAVYLDENKVTNDQLPDCCWRKSV